MWKKLVRCKFKYTKNFDAWFRRSVIHENDNHGALLTFKYRRVSRLQCFAPGENEMESRSIRSLENMSLAPRMTRGNGLWTKWILFFLSIAISERKRQNKHKEIKRGTNAPFQIPWISNSMNLMKFKFHESQIPWISWNSNSMNLLCHAQLLVPVNQQNKYFKFIHQSLPLNGIIAGQRQW